MSIVIKSGEPHAPHASGHDGEGFDTCPVDACMDVDQIHQFGGTGARGESFHHWSMFSADRAKGGCGANWTRTTRQGAEVDYNKGIKSKWLTHSAEVDRAYSLPTEAYRTNYDAIDWSK